MCTKEYNDVAKVCPLKHCPNCGSLNVKQHLIRKFVEDSVGNIITVSIFPLMVAGFFGILLTMNSSLEMRVIPFAIVSFIEYVFIISTPGLTITARTVKIEVSAVQLRSN